MPATAAANLARRTAFSFLTRRASTIFWISARCREPSPEEEVALSMRLRVEMAEAVAERPLAPQVSSLGPQLRTAFCLALSGFLALKAALCAEPLLTRVGV